MKKILSIILIGFCSGIGGALFYDNYIKSTDDPAEQISIISNNAENNNAVPVPMLIEEENAESLRSSTAGMLKPADFIEASKSSTRSVVYIKTISQTNYGSTWLDLFFGEGVGQSVSSGSGVIFSNDGYIITNNHVVNDADKIEVIVGKKSYEASLIGADASTDLRL